jgi:hypothetical protein
MPTQYLTQIAQSPADRVIGDIPLKTLAGLELSRRAQMQNEMTAMNAPNPQMPTVLDSTVQSLNPQPQQPMPQQGMMPPQQPMPQQAAPQPQPQPQQPPQPQQQQQAPQAKPNPIMGLPAMQGPKKMAGGGIIAFNGEKDSEVPKAEEATSSIGDFFRRLVEPPEFLKDRIERAKDIGYAESQVPYPWEAVTPSERARRKQETERVLAGGKRPPETSVPPAVNEDAKKKESKPDIQNAPDPTNGIAALMKAFGGMGGGGGGGGGGSSRADSETRKRLADIVATDTPEQQAFRTSALKRAGELENYQAPTMSKEERRAFLDEEFGRNQAYSKPHFDMMQKLIDEEKAANNAGKDSEFYQMLGKMGGTLMSSRGAFGPALGRAVGEGIDYGDKMDAARATAERLRRQAQMDLVKARMLDEKGDRQGAQALLSEHDRAMQAAAKLTMETRLASTNLLKDVAASDSRKQLEALKLGNQLDMSEQRAAARAQNAGLTNQMGLMRLAMQMQGMQDRGRPSIAEYYKMQEQADSLFANPFQGRAASYLSAIGPDGVNAIRKAEMMGMKPQEALKDAGIASAVEKAKAAYINDVMRSTNRASSSSSSVRDGNDVFANLPK